MIKYPNSARKYVQHKIKRSNKYHARKVEIDGITFDSKAESQYWYLVKQQYADNDAVDVKYHVKFKIMDGFKVGNKRHQARYYTPDFCIYENGLLVKVVDVKGGRATMTDAASLRMDLFAKRYDMPVTIAEYQHGSFNEHDK